MISSGPSDEAKQKLTFVVTCDNAKLFAKQPAIASDGTLSFTPAKGATGTATVSVRIRDNGGKANGGQDTSGVQTFVITVSKNANSKTKAVKPTSALARDAALAAFLAEGSVSTKVAWV